MVMVGEDIPEILKSNGTLNSYPGMEESDEEDLDAMAESYDISFGILNTFIYKRLKIIFYFIKFNSPSIFYNYLQIWSLVTGNVRILLKDWKKWI